MGIFWAACVDFSSGGTRQSLTPLPPPVPGYLGCFVDSGAPPALSGPSGTSTKLTVQVCLRFCRMKGYQVLPPPPAQNGTLNLSSAPNQLPTLASNPDADFGTSGTIPTCDPDPRFPLPRPCPIRCLWGHPVCAPSWRAWRLAMPASVALKATWTGDARPQLPTVTRFASATQASCAVAMGVWVSTKVRSERGREPWGSAGFWVRPGSAMPS